MTGIEVREWQIDPADRASGPGRSGAAFWRDGRVRMVCFPHCSNVVAEINPVAEICAMARAAGAYTCVDGVSYAPHGFPDIPALGADIYMFSAYKTYGPHQGIMVVRRGIGEALPAQGHYFNAGTLYKRFTPVGAGSCAGCGLCGDGRLCRCAVCASFRRCHRSAATRNAAVHDLMRAHEVRLLQPLLDYLAARNDLRLIGPRSATGRAPDRRR